MLFTQKEIIKINVQIAVKNLDFDFAADSKSNNCGRKRRG